MDRGLTRSRWLIANGRVALPGSLLVGAEVVLADQSALIHRRTGPALPDVISWVLGSAPPRRR